MEKTWLQIVLEAMPIELPGLVYDVSRSDDEAAKEVLAARILALQDAPQ